MKIVEEQFNTGNTTQVYEVLYENQNLTKVEFIFATDVESAEEQFHQNHSGVVVSLRNITEELNEGN